MRVAVVVKTLQIGGMEKVAVSLAEAFSDAGHESHLIFFKDKNQVLSAKKSVKTDLFDLNKVLRISFFGFIWDVVSRILNAFIRKSYFIWRGLLTSKIFAYKLKKLERKYGVFDLIIVRGQSTFEEIWALQDNRIVHVCESNVYDGGGLLHKLYMHLLYAKKNIACVSSAVETSYIQMQKTYHIGNPCVETITNPINVVETQQLADSYIPKIENKYIVSVGRLVPVKNISLLVEAYAYARKNLGLKHHLVIVGDGSENEKIKKLIDMLDIESFVMMPGFLSNPYPWMKHADLFVLSSISEGLGMVLLEAIACGTKVVSTDCDGVRDVMKDELRCNLAKQEIPDLAEKILFALHDESITYEKYLDDFMPQKIVKKYIERYVQEGAIV